MDMKNRGNEDNPKRKSIVWMVDKKKGRIGK
jgi:hypothetical protein